MPRSGAQHTRLWVGVWVAVVVCALAALSAVASAARADASALHLRWQAPAECPDEGYVRQGVEGLLAAGTTLPIAVECDARVEPLPSGKYRVTLALVRDGVSSERSIEASSCRSLADATALILALTIDPARVAAHRTSVESASSRDADAAGPIATADAAVANAAPAPDASARASSVGDATAPLTPPAPEAGLPPRTALSSTPLRHAGPDVTQGRSPEGRPDATSTPPRSIEGAAFLALAGDVGSLPKPTVGGIAGAAFSIGAFRLDGYGGFWAPAKAPAAFHVVGLEASLAAGGVRGCFVPVRRTFDVAVCSGIEGGALFVSTFGTVESPGKSESPWLAGTASGQVAWHFANHFALVVETGIVVPFVRSTFALSAPPPSSILPSAPTTGATFQPSPLAGRAWLGPEIRF